MMVWKMYMLLNMAMFGIYVNFLGCMSMVQENIATIHLQLIASSDSQNS